MNRHKLSGQLLYAIDNMGSDTNTRFHVRITRKVGNGFAANCLLGINDNQIKNATLTVVADILMEQVIFLSADDHVEFISTTYESGPPVTGC